jgi:sugar O-acyltransferase (sialic acid O-acetyltransferase NeuD family)
MKNKTQLGIIGSGGFAREVLQLSKDIKNKKNIWYDEIFFVELDDFYTKAVVDETRVLKFSECDLNKMKFIIAIGDPVLKKKVHNELPNNIHYTSLISQLSFIAGDVKYSQGLIVMPFSYVSCNVKIGKHVHINSHCTIGHDTKIGNYSTTACSVMIAGENNISDLCYFGMNSSTRQGISICEKVTIGLNAGVVKSIIKSGVYIGTPSKFLSK